MIYGQRTAPYATKHALERARERLGLELTAEDMKVIVGLILLGKAEFVNRQDNGLEAYRVSYGAVRMVVVFDRGRAIIVTVLPKRCAEDGYRFMPQDLYRQLRMRGVHPHASQQRRVS